MSQFAPLIRRALSPTNKPDAKKTAIRRKMARDVTLWPVHAESTKAPNIKDIQPKLKIGGVDDPAEAEADRIAAEVVHHAERRDSAVAPVTACSHCRPEVSTSIQVRAEPQPLASDAPAPDTFDGRLQHERAAGGSPLNVAVRAALEPSFGHDFSHVRVHDGPRSVSLARQINARAFTIGRDVFFDHGEYRPTDRRGRMLLAHELTHVVQQGRGHEGVTPVAGHIQRACTSCSAEQEEVLQRSPRDASATCVSDAEEQGELDRAIGLQGMLERWLANRVDTKDLKVGRLRKLRARRARRLCLLDRCGKLKPRLSSTQLARLTAFDRATRAGKAAGACGMAAPPAPELAPPAPEPREEETKACPGFVRQKPTTGRSLWLLANYENPWRGNTVAEAKATQVPDGWAPSLDDFRAAAGGPSKVVSTPEEVVAFIKEQDEDGIAELNIVGHGNELGLSLSGTIFTAPNAEKRVDFASAGDLTHTSFDPQSAGESLEKYFAPGASVNLYACHTGSSSVLPRGLARGICRLVRAPSETISYCPSIAVDRGGNPRAVEDRNWVYVEGRDDDQRVRTCEDDRSRSFTSLLPFMRDVEPDAKKNTKPLSLEFDPEEPL